MSGFDTPNLRGPVPLAHLIARSFVRTGDAAVDATCGNGSDTVVLADLVGETGRVTGFDIQPAAIAETARRLDATGFPARVALVEAGHEAMAAQVAKPVAAVMFNLGYLPGSDRSVTTTPDTTISGLRQALELLQPGGVIIVTVYPGHDAGLEGAAVAAWAADLPQGRFHVWRMGQMNVRPDAPYLILIQKGA